MGASCCLTEDVHIPWCNLCASSGELDTDRRLGALAVVFMVVVVFRQELSFV